MNKKIKSIKYGGGGGWGNKVKVSKTKKNKDKINTKKSLKEKKTDSYLREK